MPKNEITYLHKWKARENAVQLSSMISSAAKTAVQIHLAQHDLILQIEIFVNTGWTEKARDHPLTAWKQNSIFSLFKTPFIIRKSLIQKRTLYAFFPGYNFPGKKFPDFSGKKREIHRAIHRYSRI